MSEDTYTHGHHASVLRSHTWRTVENSAGYLLPHLAGGQRVLDVGCGPGTITIDLARHVGTGSVLGVDRSVDIVAQAAEAAGAAAVDNVSFETGDVYRLGFDDDTFDVVHAHQVLQHVSDPVAALAEMRRVTRPGGIVAARDSNYAAFWWAPADEHLDEWLALYHRVTEHNEAEADAGRFLQVWAHEAGFREVEYSSSTWTMSTPEDCAWWGDLWSERVRHSAFAEQAVAAGLASAADLDRIAAGFRAWAASDGAVFVIPHGEIIARA